MATTEKLVTAEELRQMPQLIDGSWYELFEGELIRMTPAGARHGVCCARVCLILGRYINEKGGGHVASNDTGVFIERDPDTVLAPDVAYWSTQTLPELPEGFAEVAPELAVEVVSPSDTAGYIQRKVLHYLDHGVRAVWVVDPATETVTVYCSRQEICILGKDNEISAPNVLPGFSCRVGEFFE